MNAKTTSQSQKETAETPPNPFQRMATEHLARFEQMFSDVQKLEDRRADLMKDAVDETAKLIKASFDYSQRLGADFTKLAVENAKLSKDLFGGLSK